MITQLIFGEQYEVLETQKKWVLVKNKVDNYECWIDKKQHTPIAERLDLKYTIGTIFEQVKRADQIWVLPAGSKLRLGEFSIGEHSFLYEQSTTKSTLDPVACARQFLGAPYLWGGKSIMGIDCSGLVQVVFSCCGIQLPRDAYQQAEVGDTVDFVETAQAGDLAYFDNEEGKITHVGIMLDGERIIHASGSVRIDRIDHEGIYNAETNSYSHQLRIVKRVKNL